MTQIEQIKGKIETEKEYYQDLRIDSDAINGKIEGLEFALNVIDSFQNKQNLANSTKSSKDLQESTSPCNTCEGENLPRTCASISSLGRCPLEYNKQESATEDLETAAIDYDNQGLALYAEDKDGDIVEISNVRYAAFKAGAQWQREQMMKDAIDAHIIAIGQNVIIKEETNDELRKYLLSKFQDGDKVKVIIIKE